jgi:hypothetical protein
MEILYSITPITKADIIHTMDKPVKVLASNIEYYFCKYNRISSVAYRLYKELLIASFARNFNLNVPEFTILKIRDEDLSPDLGLPIKNFEIPCFASKAVKNCLELDQHNINQLKKTNNIDNLREQFLLISFFDIWLANEDRNHNNYNLLISVKNMEYILHPIDHSACFNHNNIGRHDLETLSYSETLIYSELCNVLFPTKKSLKDFNLDSLKENCYFYIKNCSNDLPNILNAVPRDWQISIEKEKQLLNNSIFTDKWVEKVWHTFLHYLQQHLN